MKKLLAILGLATLCLAANCQTNTPGSWVDLNRDLLGNTNWTVAIAPSYAPGLKDPSGKSAEWGATLAILHPIAGESLNGQFILAGTRFDFLAGQFFKANADVTLQLPLTVAGRFKVTPFIAGGPSIVIGGAGTQDGQFGAFYGAGVKARLWQSADNKFAVGIFYEAERWTQFPGITVHHGGAGVSFAF
jgi:hypothetical protein